MFEILKALVILAIAVPFIYIVFDVLFDLSRRAFNFLTRKARPIPLKARGRHSDQQ